MGAGTSLCLQPSDSFRPSDVVSKLNDSPDTCELSLLNGSQNEKDSLPSFTEFSLDQLKAATLGFLSGNVVSEGGEGASNVVYKGKLEDGLLVAVKRFNQSDWPDCGQFLDLNPRLSCFGLFKNSKDGKNNNITNLDFVPPEYLTTSNSIITSVDVKQYSNTRFSCFGLVKNSQDVKNYTTNLLVYPPENSWTGLLRPESSVYSFGTILFDLLCGAHTPPSFHLLIIQLALTVYELDYDYNSIQTSCHIKEAPAKYFSFLFLSWKAIDLVRGKNVLRLMDPHLEGQFSNDDVTKLVQLASQCLQHEPLERPPSFF
ncbi:putative serine/threonine-protein kinase [Prunus yedoensis var. nudiflora]|uniref:Putative serine/threonine-protein kinase n=1 Tax=Prunus yedoensis var. nudiflora TaxID=2094558 RepID=A0A314U7T6_PRUYE|nr:putative serine/threonine-protein kinase [Prunus yedoensis var. nudiflora]